MAKGTGFASSIYPPHLPKWTSPDSMDGDRVDDVSGSLDGLPARAIRFPLILSATNDRDDYRHRTSSLHDGKREVIDEMDFFALKIDSDARDKTNGPTPLEPMNVNTRLNLLTRNTSSDQSMVDDGISPGAEEKRARSDVERMAILQAEVERIGTENQRLRDVLSQATADYQALQTHIAVLMQEQKPENPVDGLENSSIRRQSDGRVENKRPVVPRQFVDLSLATARSEAEDCSPSSSEGRGLEGSGSPIKAREDGGSWKVDLRKRREESPDWEWIHKEKAARLASTSKSGGDQKEAKMRKTRVSVRARSEATMITDGCQWRKYGQKMSKGNPCPRAYYRCTMAASCPVRKQVQRCAEDRSVLITTYEGNHNHPLPQAAMAMESTTSSAARMLLSGSMSSSDRLPNDRLPNDNFLSHTILPFSSSMATISVSAPFPTVTLDLTQNPTNLQSQPAPLGHFPVPFLPSGQNYGNHPNAAAAAAAMILEQLFGQAIDSQSKFSGLQMSWDMKGLSRLDDPQQGSYHDHLSAATAAIAANPNFTAALAATISSINGSPPGMGNGCPTTTNKSSKDGNGNNSS